MDKIAAIAARAFRHAGTEFAKGAPMVLTEGQFSEWESVGLVARAPVETTDETPAEEPAKRTKRT